MTRILLVDDNIHQHKLFECYASLCGDISLECRASLEEALTFLEEENVDMVFLDNRLHPFESYSQTVPLLRRGGYEGKIVVISANVPHTVQVELKSRTVAAIIDKSDLSLTTFGSQVEALLLN